MESSSLRPSRYSAQAAAAAAPTSPSKSRLSTSTSTSDRSALAYLLRYETLVRTQEVEDVATNDHLRPLFDRLMELGCGCGGGAVESSNVTKAMGGKGNDDIPGLVPSHSISTDEGDGNNTCMSSAKGAGGSDEVVLTYAAMKEALVQLDRNAANNMSMSSAADVKYSNGGEQGHAEVITTDRQLILLLRTIVDTSSSPNTNSSGADDEASAGGGGGLTYAEFLQVYKVVVGGMQTLQRLPPTKESQNKSGGGEKDKDIRQTIRARTLDLIKLFGPATTNNANANGDDASCSSSVSSLPSLPGKLNRHLHKGGKSNNKSRSTTRSSGSGNGNGNAASSNSSNGTSKVSSNKYRDPTDLPRDSTVSTLSLGGASVASTITDCNPDEVRRVLTIKDKTMLNLLSDHAGEMDDLTERMVDMSRRNKRRKTRLVLWGVAMGVLGLSIGLIVGGGGNNGTRSASTPSASSTTSSASSSNPSSTPSHHQPDLLLANELKYTKRELGQVHAKVTKLQKRLVDVESDARSATTQLYDCKSDLAIAGRQVDDLKVEMTLARDEIEACNAASRRAKQATKSSKTVGAKASTTSSSTAVVPVMKQASSAMAGASGAVLFPHIVKAVTTGSLRALAAAGGGLWAGVGLLVGAIVSGAMPSLLNHSSRKK